MPIAQMIGMTFDMGTIYYSVVLYQHTQTEYDHDRV
jgi:hypothetical protein